MKEVTEKDPLEWISERVVAVEFSVSLSWLQKRRRPGAKGIPFRKLDPDNPKSQVRYLRKDCIEFFKNSMINPEAA